MKCNTEKKNNSCVPNKGQSILGVTKPFFKPKDQDPMMKFICFPENKLRVKSHVINWIFQDMLPCCEFRCINDFGLIIVDNFYLRKSHFYS